MDNRQLVKDCIKNNKHAQQTLYNQYAGLMMGLCYRYTKSRADAEDVLQEGFIKVFKNLQQYKFEGELGAWIKKIMVNTALSYLTKHSRYRNEMQIEDIPVHLVADSNPETAINVKDLVEKIRALPIAYQTIFNLIAVEGFSYPEVEEIVQLNINTIRSRYSRARIILANSLKNDEIKHNYASNA